MEVRTSNSDRPGDCGGLIRRNFLKAGFLGLGGLTLPQLLQARAAHGGGNGSIRDKSVVLVFLGGGASHIETFNPNMEAPAPYRSVTGELATTLPGVTIGGTFPELAKRAHKMAFVRSFRHPVADHDSAIVHVLNGGTSATGKKTDPGFSMGSMYAKVRGANDPVTGLPTYALLTAPETDNQYKNEKSRVERGSAPGLLGPACAPFDPASGGTVLENMKLKLPAPTGCRIAGSQLQRSLDTLNRSIDASGLMAALDSYEQQAVDIVLRGAFSAFDLAQEDPALVARYDTSMFRIGNRRQRPQQMRDSTLGHQQERRPRPLVEPVHPRPGWRWPAHGTGTLTVIHVGWAFKPVRHRLDGPESAVACPQVRSAFSLTAIDLHKSRRIAGQFHQRSAEQASSLAHFFAAISRPAKAWTLMLRDRRSPRRTLTPPVNGCRMNRHIAVYNKGQPAWSQARGLPCGRLSSRSYALHS